MVGSKIVIRRLDTASLPRIILNGSVIPWCPVAKDIGLLIDSTLDWRAQVTQVSQKVTESLRTLYRLKHFLHPKTKTFLMQSLIVPIIGYDDVYYFDLNAELRNIIS